MAMGRRRAEQDEMFLPPARGKGHRFYEALNALLEEAGFDEAVERLCEAHYAAADKPGRPSVAPGLYFRMLLVGYFEGIGSERGIVWRCADSMSLRDFLGLPPHKPVPDQSTLSRTRRRLPPEVFDEFFRLVLGIIEERGLFTGKVQGVDSTYLKADASMRSIVRKDTGEQYSEFIKGLAAEADDAAQAHGAPLPSTAPGDGEAKADDEPSASTAPNDAEASGGADVMADKQRQVSAEDAVRHDRKRKKSTSNKDWRSPTDSDARITRMKNGTTRLAYKAEHVVDMETGAILAAEVFQGNQADTATLEASLDAAQKNIAAARDEGSADSDDDDEPPGEVWHKEPVAEVVADKGYHKVGLLLALMLAGYRTFIPEKKQRGKRKFVDKGGEKAAQAFHQNRARTKRKKGKELQRKRGELLERPNQHLYDRGGLRELTLTGQGNVRKRVLVQAAAFNLGLAIRSTLGAGAPRWLAAKAAAPAIAALIRAWVSRTAGGRWPSWFPLPRMSRRLAACVTRHRRWWCPPPPTPCRLFAAEAVSASAC